MYTIRTSLVLVLRDTFKVLVEFLMIKKRIWYGNCFIKVKAVPFLQSHLVDDLLLLL
jgi:hypothetical protein